MKRQIAQMRLKKTGRMITTVKLMLMKMIMRKIVMVMWKMMIMMWKMKLIIIKLTELLNFPVFPCIAHCLQLVVSELAKSRSFKNLLAKVKGLVKFVKISSVANEKLRDLCGNSCCDRMSHYKCTRCL
jgi:hypothetical protein